MSAVAVRVSPVERALAGWLVARPVRVSRLPVAGADPPAPEPADDPPPF